MWFNLPRIYADWKIQKQHAVRKSTVFLNNRLSTSDPLLSVSICGSLRSCEAAFSDPRESALTRG
jgi:hypothetical protein